MMMMMMMIHVDDYPKNWISSDYDDNVDDPNDNLGDGDHLNDHFYDGDDDLDNMDDPNDMVAVVTTICSQA